MPLTSDLQHLFWQQLLGRRQCDEFGKYQAELSEQVHGCNQPINSAHQLFHNLDQWTAPRQFYYSSLITWACRPTEGGRSRGWFPRSRSCPGNFSAPVALSQHCHTRRTNCVHYHVLEWMITFVGKITAGRGGVTFVGTLWNPPKNLGICQLLGLWKRLYVDATPPSKLPLAFNFEAVLVILFSKSSQRIFSIPLIHFLLPHLQESPLVEKYN